MTPENLTKYLEYLNRIDRAVADGKEATYAAIDEMRTMLMGQVEHTSGSAADVWAMAQLQSAFGTANPANETPGTGAWNFNINQTIAQAEQRLIASDVVDEDES